MNLTVFTPNVDPLLRQAPSEVWDAVAGGVGIPLGVLFAFLGARMLRTASLTFGFIGGGLLASAVCAFFPDMPGDAWLGAVGGTAVLMALLCWKLVKLARFFMFVTLGAAVAAVIAQYGLSFIPNLPDWALYTVLGACLLGALLLTYKLYDWAMMLATSFLGGFLVLLSVGRLTRGPISLAGMWGNSELLMRCDAMNCWGPFLAGAGVFVLGLMYQLFRRNKRATRTVTAKQTKAEKRALAAKEKAAADQARREERERFEKRVAAIRAEADERVAAATAETQALKVKAAQDWQVLETQAKALEAEKEQLKRRRHMVARPPPARQYGVPSERKSREAPKSKRIGQQDVEEEGETDYELGWGGGARPWDVCETHRVPYAECGCVNPRSKEEVLADRERALAEAQRLEEEQVALEARNKALVLQLKQAEMAAAKAAAAALQAEKKARLEILSSQAMEERVATERAQLEAMLLASQEDQIRAMEEADLLAEQLRRARETHEKELRAALERSRVDPSTKSDEETPVPSIPSEPPEALTALEVQATDARVRAAEARGRGEEIQQEINQLNRVPTERLIVVPPPAPEDAAATPPPGSPKALHPVASLLELAALTRPRGLSWSKKKPVAGTSGFVAGPVASTASSSGASTPAAAAAAAVVVSAPATATTTEMPIDTSKILPVAPPAAATTSATPSAFQQKWQGASIGGAKPGAAAAAAAVPRGVGEDDEEDEELPVQDLFKDVLSAMDWALMKFLVLVATLCAATYWALGKCADAARDAYMEQQEEQMRKSNKHSEKFKAADLRERFSSNVPPARD